MNSEEGMTEALRRIEECRKNQYDSLSLADLGLTKLPEGIFSGLSGLKLLYLDLDKNNLSLSHFPNKEKTIHQ